MDAEQLEMKDTRVSFQEYEGEIKDLIGYEAIRGQIICCIKLGNNFRCKTQYLGEGFNVTTPASIIYSSVVRQDWVRILLY